MLICSSGTQCPHANTPSHIILTPGRPVMFRGPHFIVNTMQAGTTPIFNVFGMTAPSCNRESNPQILLVSAGSPLSSPFTISRGYLGPIHHQGAPSGDPPPRIPMGCSMLLTILFWDKHNGLFTSLAAVY